MDPYIWGPHYWFVLHTIAFHYPKYPTSIQKKIYHRFIYNLYEFLPNPSIATTFTKLLEKYPVAPYLDSRDDFIKWMNFIHNKINERLNKPPVSLADHYIEMDNIYSRKKRVPVWVYLLSLSILLGIFYLYMI
jgi:hypothetical protein